MFGVRPIRHSYPWMGASHGMGRLIISHPFTSVSKTVATEYVREQVFADDVKFW